jgi:chromate transporter
MNIKKPSIYELLKTTTYIGVIGYGGPAILALMKKIFVNQKEWITEKEFMNALSLAQILPGSTGVSVMGYIGYKLHKLWGGILAPLFYIFPATVAMVILAWVYFKFGDLSFVKSLFTGLGSLVVALLVNAIYVLGKSVFKKNIFQEWKGLIITLVAFLGLYIFNINVIWIILLSGSIGFLFLYFTGEFESEKIKEGEVLLAEPTHIVGDKLKWLDFMPVFLVLLIFVLGFLTPIFRSLITSFLSIGIFAFGGGFTTIPLIQHQVVTLHNWLTVKQFMDGIALGQITPGPVFITATFIGYKVAAIFGALLATLAIFTPSLTLMIILADLHGKIQKVKLVQVIIKGFLSGFIGLILSVTLQFAVKSLIDWQGWLIFVLALLWLLWLKKDSLWAILGTIGLSLFIFAK